ncbi:ASCH domain-containing protein [bacterium]|nr:MAG: ASCH domain-containing protein [bacterium]
MRKSWGLAEKILSGEKKIESRWYKTRRTPWGRIRAGETVYFKNSGEPVSIKAMVSKVLQFEGLTPVKVRALLVKYSQADGIEKSEENKFYKRFKDKKYCLLVFLKNPKKIRPFEIDKSGFGMMTAWISVPKIGKIRE